MVIAVWCLVALFWITIIAKHFWMKDETRALRTRAWDYPILNLLSRFGDWVFGPLIRRAQKKADKRTPLEIAQDIELWLASNGIRSRVVPNPDVPAKVDVQIHEDDKPLLDALMLSLGGTPVEYVKK